MILLNKHYHPYHCARILCLLFTTVICHTLYSSCNVPQPCLLSTVEASRTKLNSDLLSELHLALNDHNKLNINWLKQQHKQRQQQLINVLAMLCLTHIKLTRTQPTSDTTLQDHLVHNSITHLRSMQKALEKRIAWFEKRINLTQPLTDTPTPSDTHISHT